MTFHKTLMTISWLCLAMLLIAASASAQGPMTTVPILKHNMRPGQIISTSDVSAISIEARRVSAQTVRDRDAIIGMAARRPLSAGRLLRLSDFQVPAVVEKGTRVTMVLSAGSLRLTALGKALEDGDRDAFIRVQNIETRQTVHGRVLAPNLVEVLPVGQLALR